MQMDDPEAGILIGQVPLTPIQQWFFEKKLFNFHYFNQSVLLEVREHITLQMFKVIFSIIAQYHDSLRMRYEVGNGEYTQRYTDDLAVSIEERTLDKIDSDEFYIDASKIQSSLNIHDGPIFRVVLYRCLDGQDYLLIVAHHLVIDGVSWRILIDDLETIYDKLVHTGKVALPSKTHSYRQWSNALTKYTETASCQQEIAYWEEIERSVDTLFKPDSTIKEIGEDCVAVSLDERETLALINEVPKRYDTQINDVLITALALSVGDISGNYRCSFTLEGHGREDVIGLDVSRTVGWVTSIFPVSVKITNPTDLTSSIAETKETLKKIPNKGIGYSIIKYCTGKLSKPLPRVSFNYLGRLDAGISEDSVFKYAQISSGENCDPRNVSYNLIDINGGIKNGIFQMYFSYRIDFFRKATIARFADQFKRRLLEIISTTQ